ncbi:MAG TPA: ATP-binding protein [Burkholderiales bacterium]|nr:ATP-binding protein [Burkholderiales bacterium]
MASRPSEIAPAPPLAPTSENLQRLVLLRYLMVAVMGAALVLATEVLDMHWEGQPMSLVLGLLVAANLATHWRLRQAWPVANPEFFGHLLLDVLALTALLHWSGGSENPLVSLYLIPVVVAAAVLPAGYTWLMAALTVGCYTLLMWIRDPHPVHHHGDEASFIDVHLTGMWLTFAVSASLIALFVARMAHSLRERDQRLAAAREESLRNERIVALGTMAAGAAHELGTPLNTLTLLVDELERSTAGSPGAGEDLGEMRRQLANCKRIITELLASAGQARGEGGSPQPVDGFLKEVVSKWEMMRPSARFEFRWESDGPAPRILAEQTLSQAVINLLNNAADASPDRIEIEGRCVEDEFVIEVRDHGPGLTPEVLSQAGQPFFTTKAPGKGFGLGLFLANATIERFGGSVRLFNREGGGACTEVRIPLEPLLAGESR